MSALSEPLEALTARWIPEARLRALIHGAARHAAARLGGGACWTAVTMLLTFRCNCRCAYCDFPRHAGPELPTQTILRMLRALRRAGTVRVGFSGGEPLLRSDLPELLEEAHRLGLVVSLTTNGLLLPDRIALLRNVDYLLCTVEGRPETQDRIKGDGAHHRTALALRLAASHRHLRVGLVCPVHEHNLSELDAPLALAESMGLRVYYQPIQTRDGWRGAPIQGPVATPERLRVFRRIGEWKRQGRAVGNSRRYLQMVVAQGERAIARHCSAGRYYVTILPDGRVTRCCMLPFGEDLPRLDPDDPLASATGLAGGRCRGCSISPYVENALLFDLDPRSWGDVLRWRATHPASIP